MLPRMPTFSSAPQTAAAPAWIPSIDTRGVNQARYEKDYVECKAYADADPSTNGGAAAKKKALKWGLGGAALVGGAALLTGGAALAALPALAGQAALTGGAAAATGGMAANAEAEAKYRNIVASCLQGRGYTVLN
jgi:hypothetical protein